MSQEGEVGGQKKLQFMGSILLGKEEGGCLEVAKLGFSLLAHCKFELDFLQFCSMDRTSANRGHRKSSNISGELCWGRTRGMPGTLQTWFQPPPSLQI